MAKVVDEVLEQAKRRYGEIRRQGPLPRLSLRHPHPHGCSADPGSLDEWTMNDPFK